MSLPIQHLYATLPAAYTVGGTTDSTNETQFHLSTDAATFSGAQIAVKAGTLRVGDLFQCFALLDVTAENSTDTLDLAAYLGPTAAPTTGQKVADYAALDAATTAKALEFWIAVEAVGAGSTLRISWAGKSYNTAATALSQTYVGTGVDAQLSSLADNVIALTATWSVSSAGNAVRLRSFHAIKHPALPSV